MGTCGRLILALVGDDTLGADQRFAIADQGRKVRYRDLAIADVNQSRPLELLQLAVYALARCTEHTRERLVREVAYNRARRGLTGAEPQPRHQARHAIAQRQRTGILRTRIGQPQTPARNSTICTSLPA